jgi:hypothetical protein
MAKKLNCWDFKNCGREPGGIKVNEQGICPAATYSSANCINGGKNGGRICWAIAGTFCFEKNQGIFSREKFTCMTCDFFKLVEEEENITNYKILTPVQLNQFLVSRTKKTPSK